MPSMVVQAEQTQGSVQETSTIPARTGVNFQGGDHSAKALAYSKQPKSERLCDYGYLLRDKANTIIFQADNNLILYSNDDDFY